MCTVFSHNFHTVFTPCEVAAKSLVSDATYDGRHGSPHPCLARRGRCRNLHLVSTPVLTSGEGRAAYEASRVLLRLARRVNPVLYPSRQWNLDLHALDEGGTIVETSHVPQGHDADLFSRTATSAATSTQHHSSTGARSAWASRPLCVPELFMMQSAATPGATALSAGESALSYHDLDLWTNQVAGHLRALGVGPNVLVGLCLERSLELVAGALGILKAGGAYVPLDPAYPADRLDFMLEDTRAP